MLADPCKARGCFTTTVIIKSFTPSLNVLLFLSRLYGTAKPVKDNTTRYKIDYVAQLYDFLSPECFFFLNASVVILPDRVAQLGQVLILSSRVSHYKHTLRDLAHAVREGSKKKKS